MGNHIQTYKIHMSCGGWSKGEVNDDIRALCKHEKFLAACKEQCLAAGLQCDGCHVAFEPTAVEQQVVSGMNYKITGNCCGKEFVFKIWNQPWNGGVQSCELFTE